MCNGLTGSSEKNFLGGEESSMGRRSLHLMLHWVGTVMLALLVFAPSARAGLAERLDAVLRQPALKGAEVAALVVDRKTSRVLYARNPDRPLIPASNMKILTALVVLERLGPAYRFETLLAADAPPDAQGAVENLYVRGSGDPALTSEQLWRMAADLRMRGVSHVRGNLILDDSYLDDVRWHPSWGPVSARAYHSPIGALSANYGSFSVAITPGSEVGAAARVFIDPPLPLFKLENLAQTGKTGSVQKLDVDRSVGALDRETIRVSGSIPLSAEPVVFYRSVNDPLAYAGGVIRMQLAANGIVVDGSVIAGRLPEARVPLLRFEGFPLSEIVRRYMKFSNNTIAETLVKDLGAIETGMPGSWDSGAKVLQDQLDKLGVLASGTVIVDGSGLARQDRVAPRSFVRALQMADSSFAWGPELIEALPIASADGTLAERANGAAHRVRAKTGLLTGATALSGFTESVGGEGRIFSILVNGYKQGDRAAMRAVDSFVEILADSP